jgi:cytoskeletal protein CcmA (bactofilin family)
MAKNNEPDTSMINLISSGTDINGDIISNGDIRVDGSVTGTLSTKGKVVIGPTGKIKGEIICKNSEISGTIEGRVTISQLLNLKSSCRIVGDIFTSKLSIEPGAKFSGNCKMNESDNGETAAIQKEKEPEKASK